MRITASLLAVLFMFFLVGCKPPAPAPGPQTGESTVSQKGEGFTIPGIGNTTSPIALSDYKGQVVLLDFWATWCPPCRYELPTLSRLQAELKDKGFTIIGMTVDEGDADQIAAAVKNLNPQYPTGRADEKVQAAYGGIRAIPTKFLLDRNGNIKQSYLGVVAEDKLKSDIEPLLAR